MEQQRICPNCQQANSTTARFCGRCGATLPQTPAAEPSRRKLGPLILGLIAVALIAVAAFMIYRLLTEQSGDEQVVKATIVALAESPEAGGDAEPAMTDTVPPATATMAPEAETPVSEESSPSPTPSSTPMPAPTATMAPSSTPSSDVIAIGREILVESSIVAVIKDEPPAIDGVLNEWMSDFAYSAAYRVYEDSAWDGSQDLIALWYLGYDEANLYVAARVIDDIHVQTRSDLQVFRGDSLELQIDAELQADGNDTRPSPDDYQLTLSPGDFAAIEPVAFRVRGEESGRMVEAAGHHIELAALPSPTGYTLEAAIPWSDLGVIANDQLSLGLALNANDNDRPGTAVQEVMMSTAPEREYADPTTWGTLDLYDWTEVPSGPIFAEDERTLFVTRPSMSGQDVVDVQEKLLRLGYTGLGVIDGIYGPLTEAAVKAFQADNQLTVDGIVGPVTRAKLFGTSYEPPASSAPIEFVVEGTEERNDTGIMTRPGQVVVIEYVTGLWQAGPSPTWPLVGPEGDPQIPDKSTFLVPDANVMSLIGGFGDGTPFVIGEARILQSPANERLWLAANDDDFSDNSGALTVWIMVDEAASGEGAGTETATCQQATLSGLLDTWQANQESLGCPTDAGRSSVGVVLESFERGRMIWYSANRRIYALYNDGRWQSFPDTWQEGNAEYSCGTTQSPPTPRRGFGRVWCNNNQVQQRLGAATNAEWETSAAVQTFEGGLIIRTGGRSYVLGDNGWWE